MARHRRRLSGGRRAFSSAIAAIILLFLSGEIAAQTPPCPSIDPGWTLFFPTGTVQFSAWNQQTLNMVNTMRSPPNSNLSFQKVPQSIIQRMSSLSDATTFFNQNIAPVYPEALMSEWKGGPCQIQAQNSMWILTKPVPAPPPALNYLLTDSGAYLQSDNSIFLVKG